MFEEFCENFVDSFGETREALGGASAKGPAMREILKTRNKQRNEYTFSAEMDEEVLMLGQMNAIITPKSRLGQGNNFFKTNNYTAEDAGNSRNNAIVTTGEQQKMSYDQISVAHQESKEKLDDPQEQQSRPQTTVKGSLYSLVKPLYPLNMQQNEDPSQEKTIRKVSPLHASRMQSRKIVQESREIYKSDEKELKEMRLSVENLKVHTIQRFDAMNIKSPKQWRDNLIQFRIKRKILNRENSLTEQQKEELYNNSSLTREDFDKVQNTQQQPLKIEFKGDKSPPKVIKCLPQQTINVLSSQNERFWQTFEDKALFTHTQTASIMEESKFVISRPSRMTSVQQSKDFSALPCRPTIFTENSNLGLKPNKAQAVLLKLGSTAGKSVTQTLMYLSTQAAEIKQAGVPLKGFGTPLGPKELTSAPLNLGHRYAPGSYLWYNMHLLYKYSVHSRFESVAAVVEGIPQLKRCGQNSWAGLGQHVPHRTSWKPGLHFSRVGSTPGIINGTLRYNPASFYAIQRPSTTALQGERMIQNPYIMGIVNNQQVNINVQSGVQSLDKALESQLPVKKDAINRAMLKTASSSTNRRRMLTLNDM